MDPKATKMIMMGYASNGYRLFDPEKKKIVIGRNVTFDEDVLVNQEQLVEILDESEITDTVADVDADEQLNETEANDTQNEMQEEPESEISSSLRRGTRNRRPPERYRDNYGKSAFELCAEKYVQNDPSTLEKAKQGNDWKLWKIAIESEYNSLLKNNTWTLCDLPTNRKEIQCKWVFKVKRNFDGTVDKYKARLCAKGFSQKKGFDYNETYAPVAKITTFRVLMAVACHENLFVHQIYVNCAFLNGFLDEEIYMAQPEGYEIGSKVCKLNKSLYGLKQSPRMWNQRFDNYVLKLKFNRCESDSCLYVKFEGKMKIYLLLFVDDLIDQ